jgi:dipeptidyl aminopeptidase/acylaminoacyl peptidase
MSQDKISNKINIENRAITILGKKASQMYNWINGDEQFVEITEKLMQSDILEDYIKEKILANKNSIYLFQYISDGFKIKGYISIPTKTTNTPVILLLRGGNKLFGLPTPGQLCAQNSFTVITTTYRDGVSEGIDEFGGIDVNDVYNLYKFLPKIEQQFNITFNYKQINMVGLSRGAMQLFQSLYRYPKLSDNINKIVSISGLLNIERAIKERNDFKKMLMDNFGLTDKNHDAWVKQRSTINTVHKLKRSLPILIMQGTNDIRVSLEEGYDLIEKLKSLNLNVEYMEFAEGNHCLTNIPIALEKVLNWLSNPS